MRYFLCTILITLGLSSALTAHEYWIDPRTMEVKNGRDVIAALRNGEDFKGSEYAYFSGRSVRMEAHTSRGVQQLTARDGDRPAIRFSGAPDGLVVLAHETTPFFLTYRDWAKFARFAKQKDFPNIGAKHDARGLSRDQFRESYTRHTKSLVAVGSGAGSDKIIGLATEIVALDNPYTTSPNQGIRVRVLYKGAPQRNKAVQVFERRGSGRSTRQVYRTDQNGVARIAVQAGRRYLVNSVVLREPERSTENVAWETLWASLTFGVPAR